jgi:hypothetical protein
MYYIVGFTISDYDPYILLLTLLGVISSICLFIFSKQPYVGFKKEYFRICTLFILGYLIVCFQRYVDVLIGNTDANNTHFFVSPCLINKCALLSLAGLLCFVIGYLFYNPSVPKSNHVTSKKDVPTRWLVYILFIAVLLFIYNYGTYYLSNIYSQDFLDHHKGSLPAYFEVAIKSLIFSVLILHTKNRGKEGETFFGFAKSLGLLFHLSLFVYLGLFLLTGDRGIIITSASVYFFAYILKIRPKLKLVTFFILFLIVSFSVTILGIARTMDPTLALHERVVSTLNENKIDEKGSIFNSTAELSSSVRSLHYAMDYVPNRHPFLYGYFQFRELLAVIPFSNSITKHFLDDSFQYKSSPSFITYINQGQYYKKGDGSMVVADLYISFGIFGVIIGLFLFGIFIKRIEVTLFTCNPSNISLWCYSLAFAFLGSALSISRGTILSPLQTAVFSFLILALYSFLFNGTKKKNEIHTKCL